MVQTKQKARLAIVGASVRAAAQSALRAEFDVIGADLFADADLDGVCPITKIAEYPEALAAWLAEQRVDAWVYTGALENHPELVDRMARIGPLWGVRGEALRRCRDPFALQDLFGEAGVPFPETRPVGDSPPHGGRWLAKTYRHSAGVGVWELDGDEAWRRATEEAACVQRYVEGRPLSAAFVVNDSGAALLGVTEQLLAKSPAFAYRGSVGPVDLSTKEREVLRHIGAVLSENLKLRGVIGVDLVAGDDGLHVVEINPRWTASVEVLERAAGRTAMNDLARAFAGEAVKDWRLEAWTPASGGAKVCGKRILFAGEGVVVSEEFAAWAAEEADTGRLADRPRTGEAIPAGAPVCTVLAAGLDRRPVRSALRARVAEAERRLYAKPRA